MKPFPITSFDTSSRSQRIHFLSSAETISGLSKTLPDPSPFFCAPTLESFIALGLITLYMCVRDKEGGEKKRDREEEKVEEDGPIWCTV